MKAKRALNFATATGTREAGHHWAHALGLVSSYDTTTVVRGNLTRNGIGNRFRSTGPVVSVVCSLYGFTTCRRARIS